MKVILTIAEIREVTKEERKKRKTIGFVPTMGYFHEGHLELMRQARKTCDVVIVSIFVNPIQFGLAEDYARYPRNLERDKSLVTEVKVDYLFLPSTEEMYPEELLVYANVEKLSEPLCGKFRPGHFRGVATVVAKLFNIVQPDAAFFGEKDYQQLLVVKKMVKDLNFDVKIVPIPTVREVDGLAMSSRNVYLSDEERRVAQAIPKSLQLAKDLIKAGEKDTKVIRRAMEELLLREPLINLEYLSISDATSLEELGKIEKEALIALALRVGKTRLIDNIAVRCD
ncbi:MAG: pantoate--beta-alanine ligase [Candidatus Subteraquimicrobiales bacterium]|nr:pantoate--beta-alanine ligase [Candidatus Subteraquimicrobiales bacterium]